MTTRTTIRTRSAALPAAKLPSVTRIGVALALALLVMAANASRVDAAPRRLGVLTFKGPAEGATRNAVTKAGKANKYQVVGGQAIAKTASKLRVSLNDNDGFQSVAKELGISAFVIGEVTKKKATLTVRNGLDGSVAAEASWKGANPRKLSQAVGKTFWKRLGSAIDRTKAPTGAKAAVVAEEAEAPETGADEPGDDEGGKKKVAAADSDSGDEDRSRRSSKSKKKSGDDEAGSETTVSEKADISDEPSGPAGEALIFSIGPRFVSRSLSYSQDIYRRNSKYNLGAAPEVGVNVDFYPGVLAGVGGIASDIGATVDVSYMLPVVSSPAQVGNYSTYSLVWSGGVKVRLPMGFFGTVAYGHQRFQLSPIGNASGIDVPMVDYGFVRVGGGGRINVSPEFTVMFNAAYLHCLGFGQMATANYYPKVTGAAIEAGAAVGYRISNMLELQGGASIRRYGLAFHQTPADYTDTRRIAGGAVDQYLMGYVALAVILGGDSAGGGGAAKEEAPADAEDDEAKKDEKKDDKGEEEEE